jgi:acyl-CoA reductase-like NAD-dependent aldehyde dehydrogenase
VDRIEKYLKDNHKGTILYGGSIKRENRFITPTVIENPDKESLLMKDEIFGPILPFFYYTNLDQVIGEINARPKPLVVYMFSESKTNAKIVKERTYSGSFVVNDTIMQMTNFALPFGGVGASGYGRFHGKDGFIGFSNPKSVALCSSMDSFPVNQRYPPYTESKKSVMGKLLTVGFVTVGQVGKYLLILLVLIAIAVFCGVYF